MPKGRWYSFWNDTFLDGSRKVNLKAHQDRIPLLVKAGSLLPMEEDGQLTLHLYPPLTGISQSQLYSDAGDGYGPWRLDCFTMTKPVENGKLMVELFKEITIQ